MFELTEEELQKLDENRTLNRWSLLPYEFVQAAYPSLLYTEAAEVYLPLLTSAHKACYFYQAQSHNLGLAESFLITVFQELADLYVTSIKEKDQPKNWVESLFEVEKSNTYIALEAVTQVMRYGAEKYGENSWRSLPAEAHLDHMIEHIYKEMIGDNREPNISHALCRCVFATSLIHAEIEAREMFHED
jgi:hypothetical protein